MRKPIPTTVHGVLDYMTAGLLFALPRALGWGQCATRVMDIAGSGAVAYSLLTKYEMGVVKVLPMKAHLALDAMSGAALIGAAALMDEEDTDVRATIAGVGAFEIAAAMMSQSTPRSGRGSEPFESSQPMFQDTGERRTAPNQQSMPVSPARSVTLSTRATRTPVTREDRDDVSHEYRDDVNSLVPSKARPFIMQGSAR